MSQPVAAILGSAFQADLPSSLQLKPLTFDTPWGRQTLHRVEGRGRPAYVFFRHGRPHRLLPHQINYQAQAWALREVGCGALLVTSSVGVLDPGVPLFEPLLIEDLIMLENRLPDGRACTMFENPSEDQGHLVLDEGLFSEALSEQIRQLGREAGAEIASEVVFAYVGGPRGKTAAENRMWPRLGAQVNSMTLAPEVVLANELEIPCAALVVGHKYSVPEGEVPEDRGEMADTLARSRRQQEQIILRFLKDGEAVPFGNQIFRFGETPEEASG